MDTKFSVAIHVLTMISESTEQLTSQSLATSVGTNASYIRKVLSLLKNAHLIQSQQGKSGYQLTKDPKEIALLDIYYATQEQDRISLFQVHQHPNADCPVGQHIEAAVAPIFSTVAQQLEAALSRTYLDEVIDNLYRQAQRQRN